MIRIDRKGACRQLALFSFPFSRRIRVAMGCASTSTDDGDQMIVDGKRKAARRNRRTGFKGCFSLVDGIDRLSGCAVQSGAQGGTWAGGLSWPVLACLAVSDVGRMCGRACVAAGPPGSPLQKLRLAGSRARCGSCLDCRFEPPSMPRPLRPARLWTDEADRTNSEQLKQLRSFEPERLVSAVERSRALLMYIYSQHLQCSQPA